MPEKTPAPRRRIPDEQPAASPSDVIAKSWSMIAKFGAATFATIIAPLLVAIILKMMDSNSAPPVPTPAASPATASSDQKASEKSTSETTSLASTTTSSTANPQTGAANAQVRSTDGRPSSDLKKTAVNVAAGEQANPPNNTGFHPLFNGNDLTGWTPIDKARWSVDIPNQVLIGQDLNGNHEEKLAWIYSQQTFSDFRLRFELRMVPRTDSGVTFRTTPSSTIKSRLTIQLSSFPSDGKMFPTGMIMGLRSDSNHPHTPPKTPASLKPPEEWNEVEIELRGSRLQVKINGELVQDARVDASTVQTGSGRRKIGDSGSIGLQSRSGRAEFRKIEIQNLDSSD